MSDRSELTPRERTLDPVLGGENPNNRARLMEMGILPSKGGRPSKAMRAEASEMVQGPILTIFRKMLAGIEERVDGGEPVEGIYKPAVEIADRVYRISGLDVQKVASTNADGVDAPTTLPPGVVDAIIEARKAQLAQRIVVLDSSKVAVVRESSD